MFGGLWCLGPEVRLRVSRWSTEIIFSNIGARMLDFLESVPCVLWVCACGFSPASRELLTRHLRTFLCVALSLFQISTGGAHSPHSPPLLGWVKLAVSVCVALQTSECSAAPHSPEVCCDADRGSLAMQMMTWPEDPGLCFAVVPSLV